MAKPSPCILHEGCTDQLGYGFRRWKGRHLRAHRLAWELVHGPIPPGMNVLHSCDVRNCVNVDHLWLGTHADNMADMKAKGRGRGPRYGGELRYNAKLTEDLVRQIRVSTESNASWARRIGVDASAVSRARRGENWSCVQEV